MIAYTLPAARSGRPSLQTLGAIMLIASFAFPAAALAAGFHAGRAPFGLRVDSERDNLEIMTATVLPGGALTIAIDLNGGDVLADEGPAVDRAAYTLSAPAGRVTAGGPRQWTWRAPDEPALHRLQVRREDGAAITLNVFVLTPLSRVQDGWLNGYRIGEYPATALRGLSIYEPPAGFIEVTESNRQTRLSPHFTLEQFLCKQDGAWPRYLVLRPLLLSKLEHLLAEVNAAGHRCDTFAVLSGYRTPWYNHSIGNVKYSRHVYGGAADIYIDVAPRDGQMDDLNRDGRVDVKDAAVLYAIIDERYGDPEYAPYVGGLGQYRRTPSHGPFVHVDVRGSRARWGD